MGGVASTAAMLLWRSVGGRWLLVPGFVSGCISLLAYSGMTMPGNIPLLWLLIAAPIILWVLAGLLLKAVSLQRQIDLHPLPDWSLVEAWKHLVLYSEWAIGRDFDAKKTSYTANEWNRDLYAEAQRQLQDGANLGRLQFWGRPKQNVTIAAIKELRFDDWSAVSIGVAGVHGLADSAWLHSYATDDTYMDVMVNKQQFLQLWPRPNWIKRMRDKKLAKRKEFLGVQG